MECGRESRQSSPDRPFFRVFRNAFQLSGGKVGNTCLASGSSTEWKVGRPQPDIRNSCPACRNRRHAEIEIKTPIKKKTKYFGKDQSFLLYLTITTHIGC